MNFSVTLRFAKRRTDTMKKPVVFGVLLFSILGGCGGQSVSKTSTMTGTVLDINNQPVRDAKVSTRFGNTRTSSAGTFSLPLQGTGAVEITADAVKNGIHYFGTSSAFNYQNEKTQSINIVVGIESELGDISGIVRDRTGNPLEGASVYAYNGAGSSHRVFTDARGEYVFSNLVGGVTYDVLAGGQGYRSDTTQISLGTSDSRTANFVLDDPGIPNLIPPQNVDVTTWVSNSDATAKPGVSSIELAKNLLGFRAKGKVSKSRVKATGTTLIEADIAWDEQRFPDLLGYGVYKANSDIGSLGAYDFYPEPLAAYYVDQDLRTNSTYSYALTTISAAYPQVPDQTESNLSTRVIADTLSQLNLSTPTVSPLTFRWQSGSRADSFVVYLFDEFPSIDSQSIWNNSSNRATGNSVIYNGSGLTSGVTYYYIIIGFANNDSSRTISQIGSFRL